MVTLTRVISSLVAPLVPFGMMLPAGQGFDYTKEEPAYNIVVVGDMPQEVLLLSAKNNQRETVRVSRSNVRKALPLKLGTPARNKRYAKNLISNKYHWGNTQYSCLVKLWTKESGWSHKADNPHSSAYGIPQALPGRKMSSEGSDWRTNPVTQMRWGVKYIKQRYGTPCGAWKHSKRTGWY